MTRMVRMSRSGLICEIREIRGEKNFPLFRGLLKISVGSCSVRLALWVAGDVRALRSANVDSVVFLRRLFAPGRAIFNLLRW